jgi:hypothetical protein
MVEVERFITSKDPLDEYLPNDIQVVDSATLDASLGAQRAFSTVYGEYFRLQLEGQQLIPQDVRLIVEAVRQERMTNHLSGDFTLRNVLAKGQRLALGMERAESRGPDFGILSSINTVIEQAIQLDAPLGPAPSPPGPRSTRG